jgi:outer membrane protein TolC
MKRMLFSGCLLFLAANSLFSQNQEAISLKDCYDSARTHYPVFRENKLLQESLQLKVENLKASWYPQLSMGAQATYYSDITELNMNIPVPGLELPKAPHEQYRVFFDINQTLWDGGYAHEQKLYEKKTAETAEKQLKIEMQALRERINNAYLL